LHGEPTSLLSTVNRRFFERITRRWCLLTSTVVTAQLLFSAHRDGVFRYLCRIVGPGEAPDLTQEVFLRVTRASVPDATAEAQRAWVFRIARNLALNHRRDAHRRPVKVDIVETPRPADQETAVAINEALERLADLDRDVFLLREASGLSYAEIALACE